MIAPFLEQVLYLNCFRQEEGRLNFFPESFGPCLFSAWNNSHAKVEHLGAICFNRPPTLLKLKLFLMTKIFLFSVLMIIFCTQYRSSIQHLTKKKRKKIWLIRTPIIPADINDSHCETVMRQTCKCIVPLCKEFSVDSKPV